MRESNETIFVDDHNHRHLTRERCAQANMGYRVHKLIHKQGEARANCDSCADTAVFLTLWFERAPLEFLAIIEQFVTEKSGPAALPEWLRARKEDKSDG
jgi:hypothetical protein